MSETTDPYVDNTVYVPPVPNVEEPPEDPDPEITSVFMKVSRAVDGDSHYKDRVNMALEIMGFPQSRANLVHITKQVAGSIRCTASGTVNTLLVTDQQIEDAFSGLPDASTNN